MRTKKGFRLYCWIHAPVFRDRTTVLWFIRFHIITFPELAIDIENVQTSPHNLKSKSKRLRWLVVAGQSQPVSTTTFTRVYTCCTWLISSQLSVRYCRTACEITKSVINVRHLAVVVGHEFWDQLKKQVLPSCLISQISINLEQMHNLPAIQ